MTPDASAPTILLLHGALGTGRQLEPLAERLGREMRVLTMDFEGHGLSAPGSRPYAIERFAENVLGVLDRERVTTPAHLFGYSMGGYVALHLARSAPRRVASVYTLATKFRWTPEAAARESAQLDETTIRTKFPKFAALLEGRHGAAGWPAVLERTAQMMRSMGERPPLDDTAVSAIECAVRVGVGDRDGTVSVEESAGLARALPSGELEVFPRTPHPVERVSWQRLAFSVSEFVAAAERAAREPAARRPDHP